eukprot:7078192-Prymnesium_polylepis.1
MESEAAAVSVKPHARPCNTRRPVHTAMKGSQSVKRRSVVAIAAVKTTWPNVAARSVKNGPVLSSTPGAHSAPIITASGCAAKMTPMPVDVRPCDSAVCGKKGAISEKLRSLNEVARQQKTSDVLS